MDALPGEQEVANGIWLGRTGFSTSQMMEWPDKSFLDYEPMLWRVLSKLVRDGYMIQPHDARDLIHE